MQIINTGPYRAASGVNWCCPGYLRKYTQCLIHGENLKCLNTFVLKKMFYIFDMFCLLQQLKKLNFKLKCRLNEKLFAHFLWKMKELLI